MFQPNVNGLPTNVTSAVISSNQPLISTVNERGPGTIAGTYVGLATGKTSVALPVMAKGVWVCDRCNGLQHREQSGPL